MNIDAKFNQIAEILLNERNEQGYWDGQLSSSALGVAVSVIAFQFYDEVHLKDRIKQGITWLIANQNPDGGYGDSPESISNISTSLLCLSALNVTIHVVPEAANTTLWLAGYLKRNNIDVSSNHFAQQVLTFYKDDYTFSVPILATCALCGIPENEPFKRIPQLPFELALMPRSFYRLLKLNVVSYAIPALIAVGLAIFKNKPSSNLSKPFRTLSINNSLKLLDQLVPDSGGFLEAIPLTAFVSLSLIKAGYRDLRIVEKGIDFLKRTQREDGSWAIDIDLSTWVTTLSVKALRNKIDRYIDQPSAEKLTNHLVASQNKTIHPFNGTSPGGWGWTHFSGSVPDGDDTPGVILALLYLNNGQDHIVKEAITAGCDWLLKLQNSNGGFPTFAQGWGKLPFDQSCSDLTGHVYLALSSTLEKMDEQLTPKQKIRYQKAADRAAQYLIAHQHPNGSWLPLWFGNQLHTQQHNPVYGTARVCAYLTDAIRNTPITSGQKLSLLKTIGNAQNYLLNVQNSDGSWGGDQGLPGSIEETSLAITALASTNYQGSIEKALLWIDNFVNINGFKASPIGLYFASLWYNEKLYPVTMYAEALARLHENI